MAINYGQMATQPLSQGIQTGFQIGQAISQRREQEQRQQAQQEALQQAAQLYQTGTPDEIAQFSIQNPQAGQLLNQQIGFRNQATQQNMLNSMREVMLNPENTEQILRNRIAMVEAEGGNASETIQDLQEYRQNPQAYLQKVEKGFALMDPKGYESYKSSMTQATPEYTNVQFDESGTPYGINKATGQYEQVQGGFQRAKPTPQTVVNVGKAEGEQAKVIAKAEGEAYNQLRKDATLASKTDATLNQLEKLSDKAFSGSLAGAKKNIAKIASSFGLDVEGLTETELFEAMSNELTLGQTAKLTGVLTDRDMQFLQQTVPQLNQTAEGRKKLIGIMKEVSKATKEKAKLAAKFRKENQGKFDSADFEEWLQGQEQTNKLDKFYQDEPTQQLTDDDLIRMYL